MIVDDFLDGHVAIRVSESIPFNDLLSFQFALEDYAGKKLGHNRHHEGFADYCRKIITHLIQNENKDEIEVCYELSDVFEYMPSGTDYFIDNGYNIVPFWECADELDSSKDLNDVAICDFESVFD